jgi:hypothetical protein
MKSNFFITATAMLLAVSVASCTKETATAVSENHPLPILITDTILITPPVEPAHPLDAGHDWVIGSLIIRGQELADNYNNSTFQFQQGDLMIAITRGNSVTGSWSMLDTDHLEITFKEAAFVDLNGTWPIISITDKSIFFGIEGEMQTLRLDIKP